jgi:hypothetical protein
MMRRVDLPAAPDGTPQWADLRSKDEVTTRDRRRIRAMSGGLTQTLPRLQGVTAETDIADLDVTEDELDLFFRVQEATVAAFVAAWSLPDPPSPQTVGDMPVSLYDALCELTADDGANLAASTSIVLDTSPGPDGVPDPKDPSGSSGNSDGPLKDESAPTPTLT